MLWLITLALASELTDPVAVDQPVVVGEVTYTSAEPIYLLPTPTFDRMLEDTKKLHLCEGGLDEIRLKLREAGKDLAVSQASTTQAIATAGSALQQASEQMDRDAETDLAQVQQLLELQDKVGRAQSQRNVALGITGGVLAAGLAYGFASR